MCLPYDGVDPGVEVREESEGDEAGDDEPGHVHVPQDVTGIEPEFRRVDRLRSRVDVLLGGRREKERNGITLETRPHLSVCLLWSMRPVIKWTGEFLSPAVPDNKAFLPISVPT